MQAENFTSSAACLYLERALLHRHVSVRNMRKLGCDARKTFEDCELHSLLSRLFIHDFIFIFTTFKTYKEYVLTKTNMFYYITQLYNLSNKYFLFFIFLFWQKCHDKNIDFNNFNQTCDAEKKCRVKIV